MYKIGQQVKVNHPGESYDGEVATIITIEPGEPFPYQVRMKDGLFWMRAEDVVPANEELQSHDFDRGFGIGGLGRYIEKPIVPTVAQIKRIERMEAQAITCRRCGQSDVFDGAMFTTGGGSVCDDCF